MKIEFDEAKRGKTLLERGLDFAHAEAVFEGLHFTAQDTRVSYEEDRFITVGWLDARLVVLVWTPRGAARRIISMRKANDREKTLYASYLE
ncbi:BrnT family toxin [Hydrogenophaga sp.]|uniref:BrnT family toxin n=1 Tax=Hydrogenophaga sp. TaxID=1904254 RepID=UPI003F6AB735